MEPTHTHRDWYFKTSIIAIVEYLCHSPNPETYCLFVRMLTAMTNSQDVSKASLKALVLADQPSKHDDISQMTFSPELSFSQMKALPEHEMVDIKSKRNKIVTFVNSLGHKRVQLVTILVNSVDVMVRTPHSCHVHTCLVDLCKSECFIGQGFI